MEEDKKEKLRESLMTFVKAIVPPQIALVSSVLTTLLTGDTGTGATVGSLTGTVATIARL